jgi:hypothetical protein
LRSAESGLTDAQASAALKQLSKGRVDSVSMRTVSATGDLRLYLERAGAESGFQRLSFRIAPDGSVQRMVQTAFDDAATLVRQRPGAAKNNLYDVKK